MTTLNFLVYTIGFVIARGGLFVAPIVLANMLPLESYGAIEVAQSIAALIALVVGIGLPASVPLILLRNEVTARWDTLLWLVSALSGLAIAGTAVSILALGGGLSLWVLIPMSVGLLMLQSMWSANLKASGHANVALFLEMGFWLSAVIGAAISVIFVMSNDWVALALGTYALVLWTVTLRSYHQHRASFGVEDLRKNVGLGVPLMVASLLTLLVSSGGRLILGITSDPTAVGTYAVLFRATALPLIGHQILIVAFYRQLYVWDTNTLKRRAPLIPIGVSVFVVGFWVLSDSLGWMLGARFEDIFGRFRFVGLIILSQTILWSAISLNDLLNSRLQIASFVARFSLPLVVLGMAALTGSIIIYGSGSIHQTLLLISIGQSMLMAGFYVAQCTAAIRKGHSFWHLWMSVIGCYSVIVVSLIIGRAQL